MVVKYGRIVGDALGLLKSLSAGKIICNEEEGS
jgi:hypothetical protein